MRKFILIFCILSLFMSCSERDFVTGGMLSVGNTWDKGEEAVFEIIELDSLQPYNVYLNLRNSHQYAYNNIYLIVSLEYPHGKLEVDTLQYRMAYPNGDWMGDGIGSVKENLLWYKENFLFTEKGNYKLSIEQAVRENGKLEGEKSLKGIIDVGYRIEKVSTKKQ